MSIESAYAKAFLSHAIKQGMITRVVVDMQRFLKTCEKTPALVTVFRDPTIHLVQKEEMLALLKSQLHTISYDFLLLVLREQRAPHLLSITETFLKEYRKAQAMKVAEVTTAHPVDSTTKTALKQFIQRLTSNVQQVMLNVQVDPRIMGGYVLRLGPYCLDASLRTQLEQLQRLWL